MTTTTMPLPRHCPRRAFDGRKLAEYRRSKRLSQWDLAKAVREQRPRGGLNYASQAAIAAIECGSLVPDANVLMALVTALAITVDDVLVRLPPVIDPADLPAESEPLPAPVGLLPFKALEE